MGNGEGTDHHEEDRAEPSRDHAAEHATTQLVADDVAKPETEQSAKESSFARFLYTQNPFYLISCLLVIYGCQSLAVSSGDALTKAVSMAGGIASYTLLMVFVCVAVVRLAKVWQDARSILIVVLISLAAMTTGFDELCIMDRDAAMAFSIASALIVFVVLESVRRLCRLRLGFWYTAALYAHFAVLIAIPNWLGNAVASRNDALSSWGAMLFSVAISVALLLLAPAVRQGVESTKDNGTPWGWPLFPLAAFLVLMVLAAIRAHAVWMSFGFYGVAKNFEPFLLLPMGAAAVLLMAESGHGRNIWSLQRLSLLAAPALALCGLSNDGDTWLPIRADLQMFFGSSWTASLLAVLGLYVWFAIRRIRHSFVCVLITLFSISWSTDLPRVAESYGLQSWMIAAAASVGVAWITFRNVKSDWAWLSFAASITATLLVVGKDSDNEFAWQVSAAVFALVAMLVIGARFETELATVLRHFVCMVAIAGLVVGMARGFARDEAWVFVSVPGVAVFSLVYAFWVRRSAWLWVSMIHAAVFVVLVGWSSRNARSWKVVNWPIASGMACLGVGLAITSSKAGVYQRMRDRRSAKRPSRFRPGL